MITEHFTKVICTKSSRSYFKVGDIYACIGDNNGVHVFYINKAGDPVDVLCHNFGESFEESTLHPVDGDVDFDTEFETINSTYHKSL